ncbi:Crp/Fnr family transcriptional regulator [Mycobacterium sp. SMC-4]|uniref:Crp/Fnr family transcriptional regulator n=1 Tax=Mycobacterium sp. SMC-4 TaxID=2857059 RepID=UPI0021B46162|nr:Crp/Fnr family transcriptional regulator [Mycobacterium sp. SMC-4]UXA16473.1 Crp/Fnr family transcriptional regulator [Mycobacterium sp. SMC-4]
MHQDAVKVSFFGIDLPELMAVADVDTARFTPGQVILAEGDDVGRLHIVAAGRVRIGRHRADRECLFGVLGPGEMFGEESVFDPGPSGTCAIALTDVEVVAIGRRALLSLLIDAPEAAQRIMRILARRVRRRSGTITDTVYADVTARVAKQLLALAQRFGQQHSGAIRVPMELTQEQFAQLVGSSRESVNKALSEFVERGWIIIRRDAILIRESEPLATRMHGARRHSKRGQTITV